MIHHWILEASYFQTHPSLKVDLLSHWTWGKYRDHLVGPGNGKEFAVQHDRKIEMEFTIVRVEMFF